jgi:hypothetical protein
MQLAYKFPTRPDEIQVHSQPTRADLSGGAITGQAVVYDQLSFLLFRLFRKRGVNQALSRTWRSIRLGERAGSLT